MAFPARVAAFLTANAFLETTSGFGGVAARDQTTDNLLTVDG